MPAPAVQLFLSPGAEETWTQVVRPWLQAGHGRLARRFVVVPTRGQALAWKQCCVREGLALLGVEFITPGLARRKWRHLLTETRPVLGKEFLLLGLRGIIADRIQAITPDDPTYGYWQSLSSDPERALEAFDDLQKAGFGPNAFPRAVPAQAFSELREWVSGLSGVLGHEEAQQAALRPLGPGDATLDAELLVPGLGAEAWGEFFNVAALVRRTQGVTVVVPMPTMSGAGGLDEEWAKVWEAFLGVPAEALEVGAVTKAGVALAESWIGTGVGASALLPPVELLIGENREAELHAVVGQVEKWLNEGAADADAAPRATDAAIGLVLPGAGPGHRRLVELLRERAIPFNDLVGRVAAPPPELQLQRAVVEFWAAGARLDDLFGLWPRVRALNCVRMEASYGKFRSVIEGAFEEACDHSFNAALPLFARMAEADNDAAAKDVLNLAAKLLPAWPERLSLADAIERFRDLCAAWRLPMPETLASAAGFAAKVTREWPRALLADFLLGFLPETAPAEEEQAAHGGFAPVTLSTRRRAEGVPWTHLIVLHANAGEWPQRRDPNPWLTDAERAVLSVTGRFSIGLFTSEQTAGLEKAGMAALIADASEAIALSAAVCDERDAETRLSPNSILERVLWARGERRPAEAMVRMARPAPIGAAMDEAGAANIERWRQITQGRNDGMRPFDEFFLSLSSVPDESRPVVPERVSPHTVEASFADPAVWWFKGLLGLQAQGHDPLQRVLARRRGTLAHRLLAGAVRSEGCAEGEWGPLPGQAEAERRLAALLAAERAARPDNLYWRSEYIRLAGLCRDLLGELYQSGAGDFVAVEWWLPSAALLDLDGIRLPLRGRIDVVRSDRRGWEGAQLHLYDYKTGKADEPLSAARMAARGESLQLGVYLAGVRSLGIAGAQVWKLQPQKTSSISEAELAEAMSGLARLARALRTGKFGALTADVTGRGADPWAWPLATVPVPARTLRAKYAATFPEDAAELPDQSVEAETEAGDV